MIDLISAHGETHAQHNDLIVQSVWGHRGLVNVDGIELRALRREHKAEVVG